MKINSRSRIALDAMLDVAVNGARLPVTLMSISERQEISLSYLEQLFRRLRNRGLVKSARGPGGGYQLNKRISAISVADIVDAVDEPAQSTKRRGRNVCNADGLWDMLDHHLLDYLRTVTLESVLQQAAHPTGNGPVRMLQPAAPNLPAPREERRALAAA